MLDPAICRHGRFSARGPSSRRNAPSAFVPETPHRRRDHRIVIHRRRRAINSDHIGFKPDIAR
jgi:hypothetical protein